MCHRFPHLVRSEMNGHPEDESDELFVSSDIPSVVVLLKSVRFLIYRTAAACHGGQCAASAISCRASL